MGLLLRAVVTAVAIAVTAFVLYPHMQWGLVDYGMGELGKWLSLLLTAIVLGLVNAFVRPILVIISLPLTCATLGLFIFVINALMLWLVSQFPQQLGFTVENIFWALIGSVLISLCSGLLSKVVR
ncbi:MAG: phage holin family protein [Candidatus Limnocylindria bacterium]|nr:phage holin family protein [Candidatus Limnocylindria bacterium]